MKTLKICLVILCLLHVRAVGSPRISGATFFMDNEIWLPVKGYEDHYEVSNQGRVRSKERFLVNKIHKNPRRHNALIKRQTPHYKNGYLSVMLKVNSKEKRVFVHRLVAEHFIPNPENKAEVNHVFGDKNDNRACVLEWMTPLENTRHAISIGLTKKRHPIIAIKETSIIEFESKKKAGEYLNVCNSWVGQAVKRGFEINGFKFYSL
jgi:hypothetical protein